jgi:hypothetical protein
MKKIILVLILLMVSSMVFATSYSKSTDSLDLTLEKGWNMVPLLYDSTSYSFYSLESVNQCNPVVTFFYHPKYRKYFKFGEEWNLGKGEYANDTSFDNEFELDASTGKYTYANSGGVFVYLNSACSAKINNVSSRTQVGTKIKQGWNFITVVPWMIGQSFNDVFKNCNVTAANRWMSATQSWGYPDSAYYGIGNISKVTFMAQFDESPTQPQYQMEVGTVIVVKVANDCQLNKGSTGSPPALPN